MTTYVAFLQGINVGAHNRMSMDDLRAICADCGFENPRTYGNTGNVAFEAAGDADADSIAATLEAGIADAFDYDVPVLVRTREALAAVLDRDPFPDASSEGTSWSVSFLASEPDADAVRALEDADVPGETVVVEGREVHSLVVDDEHERGRYVDVADIANAPATRRTRAVLESVLDLADE